MTDMTAVGLLARQLDGEEAEFAADARAAADLATDIASGPARATTAGDLTRLSQRVAELVRRAAKIQGARETLTVLTAPGAITKGQQ
ncbi:hypothetical protein ACFWBI_36760 [Streptomyces sp. NPDC059982]|uniref:hypothetical protein n=1 Tax=unclassified Streptomyces TaxID=2593676 RepID=UPI003673C9C9